MPSVSICIPTYNRKDYLKKTLDSCFAQTFKDYEVLVVDDGSTDGTEEMIKNSGYNARYYWQRNSGEPVTRNKLIELANAPLIAFIDSDDILMPDALERMFNVVKNTSGDVIVYGSYFRIDQYGNYRGKCTRKLYSGYITRYLFQDILIHPNGSMFPRQALIDGGGFDTSLRVCADYDMWLRLSLKYRFIALPDPTFKRRRHSSNLSSASFENRLTELFVLERFYYQKGGNKAVPKLSAMRRLSKEGYRAGRWALNEGRYQDACSLFAVSFKRFPNIKSLVFGIKSLVAKSFSPSTKSARND